MKLIWTRSSMPLSKAIRWLSKEPVSHFAIVFDESLVFHSNLFGVHLQWFTTFKKGCEIVYSIEVKNIPIDEEEKIYRSIVNHFDGYGYDYKALFYFGWRLLMRRLFRKPLPANNRWDDEKRLLCTELAEQLPHPFKVDKPTSITTPYELFQIYKAKLILRYDIAIKE